MADNPHVAAMPQEASESDGETVWYGHCIVCDWSGEWRETYAEAFSDMSHHCQSPGDYGHAGEVRSTFLKEIE